MSPRFATIKDENERVLKKEVDSSFYMQLKELPWIPATKTTVAEQPNQLPLVEEKMCYLPGNKIYSRDPKLMNLLGCHVPYFAVPGGGVPERDSFVNDLQVRHAISRSEVIEMIRAWCKG